MKTEIVITMDTERDYYFGVRCGELSADSLCFDELIACVIELTHEATRGRRARYMETDADRWARAEWFAVRRMIEQGRRPWNFHTTTPWPLAMYRHGGA